MAALPKGGRRPIDAEGHQNTVDILRIAKGTGHVSRLAKSPPVESGQSKVVPKRLPLVIPQMTWHARMEQSRAVAGFIKRGGSASH